MSNFINATQKKNFKTNNKRSCTGRRSKMLPLASQHLEFKISSKNDDVHQKITFFLNTKKQDGDFEFPKMSLHLLNCSRKRKKGSQKVFFSFFHFLKLVDTKFQNVMFQPLDTPEGEHNTYRVVLFVVFSEHRERKLPQTCLSGFNKSKSIK